MQESFSDQDLLQMRSVRDFFQLPKKEEDLFYNLCFCLLVPRSKWEDTNKAVTELRRLDFFHVDLSQDKLEDAASFVRFHRNKASYLVQAKSKWSQIRELLDLHKGPEARRLLIEKVCGVGPKVASHFLRNLGDMDIAILDVHSLRFLRLPKPKTLSEYEYVEREYRRIATERYSLGVGELDLLVWQRGSGVAWAEMRY